MKLKIVQVVVVILVALACRLLAIGWWGSSVAGSGLVMLLMLALALAVWLSAVSLAAGARRLSARVWLFTGLVVLAALALPVYTIGQHFQGRLPVVIAGLLAWYPSLIAALSLVIAALLLASGLNLYREWQQADPAAGPVGRAPLARTAAACLALSACVLAMTFRHLYWLTVWDNTDDPLGYIWIALPILAALFSGVLLSDSLVGRARWAGLAYALLVPALMIAVSARAQRVDFRQLTLARAERTRLAIEAYYAREGRYPQGLGQLIPRYALSLPGPVILSGQDWCYDGGDDYYRLGYVYRAHWSDPRLVGRTYAAQGAAPALPGMCDAEIAAIRQSDPGYYGAAGE